MDSTALSLSMDNNIPIVVFNLSTENSIINNLVGQKGGTKIGASK